MTDTCLIHFIGYRLLVLAVGINKTILRGRPFDTLGEGVFEKNDVFTNFPRQGELALLKLYLILKSDRDHFLQSNFL